MEPLPTLAVGASDSSQELVALREWLNDDILDDVPYFKSEDRLQEINWSVGWPGSGVSKRLTYRSECVACLTSAASSCMTYWYVTFEYKGVVSSLSIFFAMVRVQWTPKKGPRTW